MYVMSWYTKIRACHFPPSTRSGFRERGRPFATNNRCCLTFPLDHFAEATGWHFRSVKIRKGIFATTRTPECLGTAKIAHIYSKAANNTADSPLTTPPPRDHVGQLPQTPPDWGKLVRNMLLLVDYGADRPYSVTPSEMVMRYRNANGVRTQQMRVGKVGSLYALFLMSTAPILTHS